MLERRTNSIIALLAACVFAFGGGIWHQVLLHAPGQRVCAQRGHDHHVHVHGHHAHHHDHGHGPHHHHSGHHSGSCSLPAEDHAGQPQRGPVPHEHPGHDCSVCALMAAGVTLTAPASETAIPVAARRPLVTSQPLLPCSVWLAAPALPRAPPCAETC